MYYNNFHNFTVVNEETEFSLTVDRSNASVNPSLTQENTIGNDEDPQTNGMINNQ